MKNNVRESLLVAMLMALSSGFMDAYTFFHYHGRFAGAQTGNLIQAGIALAKGNFPLFFGFLTPILFFIAGLLFKVFYSEHLAKQQKVDSLYLLSIQLVGLTLFTIFYAGIWQIPETFCVAILSFFMAIQYDTFNRARGMGYTSVFTTGNLRILSVNFAQWVIRRDEENLHRVKVLAFIIPSFFIGAFLSTLLGGIFGVWTLLGSSICLFIVFLIYRLNLMEE